MPPANLRLTVDTAALAANWRMLARASGSAACGAAVKADGYGLGAATCVAALARAGARDFFVASWSEAAALTMPEGTRLAVLHGVQDGEIETALASAAVPVLGSAAQVARWRDTGRPCDIMVDTGMNRLGLTPAEAVSGLLDGLAVDTLHSHLACADTPGSARNSEQLAAFRAVVAAVPARRASLANSAGIFLGGDYAFDLTRPGLALYGGVPCDAAAGLVQVARLEARVVQCRTVAAGDRAGYGGDWTAPRASRLAVLNIGYADGYRRGFAGNGSVLAHGVRCPLAGRVSMDLTTVDVTGADVAEGDWVELEFDLASAARATGIAQYELLTGIGHRYARVYT